MKYYLDTEFIEYPNTIELISIGIKCEDGSTFYAENYAFDERKANQWIKENVIPQLQWYGHGTIVTSILHNSSSEICGTIKDIRKNILSFIGKDIPEFWGYYSAYDWVIFCWIFGAMVDLPRGWPMYCRDLKQLADERNKPEFPPSDIKHNALEDAIWNEKFHQYLMSA